jgi:hypothetical protein
VLIISLVLAVIGLAALVFAVITSNELIAWVCIGASVLGVVLLIVDALQERQRREAGAATDDSGLAEDRESGADEGAADYPEDASDESSTDTDSDSDANDSVSDDHNTARDH